MFTPSQRDLAKVARVSRSTVSRALTNHPSIPPKTRDRILKIAEKLGYQKNAVVSMLTAQMRASRLRKTESTLAYITSQATPKLSEINATYHEFFLGAEERAKKLGYSLDIIWRKEAAMTAGRVTKILLSRGIRGLIIAPRPLAMGHISLDWSKFAAASIGHALPAPRINYAGAWHYALIDHALRMLRKYGYQRVGYVIWTDSDSYSNHAFSARFQAYQRLLPANRQVPFFFEPTGRENPTRQKFERWFRKHRPDVLLTVGPELHDWLRLAGLSCPKDTSYLDLCLENESGAFAGMYEMPRVIAATAVDLVVEQLHHNTLGIPDEPKSVLFAGKWVDGLTLPRLR